MNELVLGSATVDLQTGEVNTRSGTLALTDLELRVLQYLHEHKDEVISREELLVRVWGYREGVHSRTVDTTIQRLRTKIEADPSQPAHLHTVRGSGYRLLLPTEPAPQARPLGPIPRLERLVGREVELRTLRALLQRGATRITLTGPSGIGKTWLARRALTELGDAGRTSVWFASLEGAATSQDLLHALSDALGLGQSGDPCAEIVAHLSRAPSTGVLDDLQGLDDEALALLSKLLRQVPQLVTISTSQRLLGLEGEHRLEVTPLDLAASVAVLRERLSALGLPLPSASDEEALAARAEGLPLALELLCPLLEVLPAQRLLALPDLLALQSDRPDLPARHRSLGAAVQASLALLDAPSREVLRQLSVFAGPFTLEAAEAIVQAQPSLTTALTVLSRRSLLRRLPDQRLALDSPVRAMLRAQLEPELLASLRERLARWLCDRGTYVALLPWRLDLQESLQHGPVALVGYMAMGLSGVTDRLGPIEALPAIFLRALERDLPDEVRARLLRSLAWAHVVAFQPAQAERAVEQGLRLADAVGNKVTRLGLLVERARAASMEGRYEDAVCAGQEAVRLGEGLGQMELHHMALETLALVHMSPNLLPDLAAPLHERAIALARAAGRPVLVAISLMHLAGCLEDTSRALSLLREALSLLEGQGSLRLSGCVWANLGARLAEQGLRPEATDAFERARELLREAGDMVLLWINEVDHAAWLAAWGQRAEGSRRLQQARNALSSRRPPEAERASVYLAVLARDREALRGSRQDRPLVATALALLEGAAPPGQASAREVRLLRELLGGV